jgi:hypothetical protein
MTTDLPRTPRPRTPEDAEAAATVLSDNVVAPVEPVMEETAEAPVRLSGLRRAPERNVGG